MFGMIKRLFSPVPDAESDITTTMVSSFDGLKKLVGNPDPLERLFGMNARLAAMIGALRDVYPNIPIANDGPGMELIETIAKKDVFAAQALSDELFELIRHCPKAVNAKTNVMIFILSPTSIPPNDRPRVGMISKWNA